MATKDFVTGVAKNVVKDVLQPYGEITRAILDTTLKSVNKANKVVVEGNIDKVEKEARLQEIESRISEFQAKVAQELAIARRIENAVEVEIEEFYDTSGKGAVGVQANSESGINLGLNGSGRKVTKRIYRFKGMLGTEELDELEEVVEEIEKVEEGTTVE